MSNASKVVIVVALIAAVVVVVSLKQACSCRTPRGEPSSSPPAADVSTRPAVTQPNSAVESQPSATPGALPRLVDLGADQCIPCKMMTPILEGLRTEYAGRLRVEFYDVWKNPGVGQQYGIRVIPTQIFYDASGKELWRHEGFISKEDILAKWKELGFDLQSGGK